MLLDDLRPFVRTHVPEHLQGLFAPDGETQLLFPAKRIRIPHDGNGSPVFDDTSYYPPVSNLQALGVTGWNYVDGSSHHVTIDLDGLNHKDGHSDLDDLVARLCLLDQVEIIRSKSGKGYHARVYFDPESAPRCRTREQHIAVAGRALVWLSSRIGEDLQAKADAVGVVAWIFHVDRGPNGFEIVKRSTAFMPLDWESEFPQHVKTGECEIAEPALPVTAKHQAVIDALMQRGMGEWKDGRLTTHTYNLLTIAEELKINGFATIASGKNCPVDRNCFAFPDANGSWRVFRFGKNTTEHATWWKSANGHTTTWFNKGREAKADVATVIVALTKNDELFHDNAGRAYVTTVLQGIKETLPLSDSRYRAKLRLGYTSQTGRIASADNIATAIAQLEAIALLERPEFPVAIRVAEFGNLYIDLANRERQIVEISPTGWKLVDDAPVRFIRPFGCLPLPVPLPGGKLEELRQFANVDDVDIPLLLTAFVGSFHPTGPYFLLQVVGEQGSAKTGLLRLIHDFVDPQIAVGNTLPKDERDLLVAAQQRWLNEFR